MIKVICPECGAVDFDPDVAKFTEDELKLMICAIDKLDCSACRFVCDCDDDKNEYCVCDDALHKLNALCEAGSKK